jgi:hypothetical protein
VTDGTRAWVRSLPLLLMSSFLMLGAAWAFFQGKDNVASIAAFSAGLLLLGAWLATAIIDWHEGHAPVAPTITKEEDDGESA